MTERACRHCGRSFVPVHDGIRCCSRPCAGALRRNRPEDLWRYVAKSAPDQCWPWTRWLDRDGYGAFTTDGRTHKAHRLAFQLATGTDPGSLVVCHSCDNPSCCNPAHLFLGTQADNLRDMRTKGRSARGSRHPFALLTEAQVVEIRQRRASGALLRVLKADYGINEGTLSEICNRKLWRHVA